MKSISFSIFLTLAITGYAQNSHRWNLDKSGGIEWQVKQKPHVDHIEMSGLQVSAVIHYGVDSLGQLVMNKRLIYPMLRTIPNNTHASLIVDFTNYRQFEIKINNEALAEYPKRFELKGKLIAECNSNIPGITITHTLFPSVDKAALIELVEISNNSKQDIQADINNHFPVDSTDPSKGVYGQYIVQAATREAVKGIHFIRAGEHYRFGIAYNGRKQTQPAYTFSEDYELAKREKMVAGIFNDLVLETPNDTINRAFSFAKLRATESIYDTKGGLMHGPGGEAYYAAIWANDQAEYANPFFPFLGNINGNESAINAYRHFARFINPEYKPIPSSIIAEGTDIWNGAGDRGDMAMIAYGASRFALASGKIDIAKELWPLITWCFEYLDRKKTNEGVIASDNDELEGRFYAGTVNLSTNGLAYGGYRSAAALANDLGDTVRAKDYRAKANQLRKAIESYFGGTVQGFATYKYYKENTKLRAWICIPLVMGITERKDATIKALLSDYLWTSNGILTESGSKTFWDRSTLYAFRGLMAAGATDRCMPYFNYYSATRLLGEHVPYPVEAWPEGNQRHLSAESALYCRAITEGLFGINPTGLNKFTMMPRLPKGWNYMRLKNIKAFNHSFDIEVSRQGANESVIVKLENGKQIKGIWNGKEFLSIEF
ncbi:MAG: hypothetical protein JSS70_20595 [Bacteroidetes bacterium]|nr:hypothetical protein [Bacteroidota bacterium]